MIAAKRPGERSKGKARPRLPRSKTLYPLSASEPNADRDAKGLAQPGNSIAAGRGVRQAIRGMVGRTATDLEMRRLIRAALAIFRADTKHLSAKTSIVWPLIAARARSIVVAGFFADKAAAAGLHTKRGMALDERATKHGARVERLTVTILDVTATIAGLTQAAERNGRRGPPSVERKLQATRLGTTLPAPSPIVVETTVGSSRDEDAPEGPQSASNGQSVVTGSNPLEVES